MLNKINISKILRIFFSFKKFLIVISAIFLLIMTYFIFDENNLYSDLPTDCYYYSGDNYQVTYSHSVDREPSGEYDSCWWSEEYISDEGFTCKDYKCYELLYSYDLYNVSEKVYDPWEGEYVWENIDTCKQNLSWDIGIPVVTDTDCDQTTAYLPCSFPPEINGVEIECCE